MYAPKFRHWMSAHDRLIERRVPEILAELTAMADAARRDLSLRSRADEPMMVSPQQVMDMLRPWVPPPGYWTEQQRAMMNNPSPYGYEMAQATNGLFGGAAMGAWNWLLNR